MNQRNCSPLDYLLRLRIWRHVFGSAPDPIGITSKNQIVSQHRFVKGTPPSQPEVDQFLNDIGFVPLRPQYWLWQKEYVDLGFSVGLGDARDENFVKTSLDIVPIDIRLWFASLNHPSQMVLI
jgi:hypothetical protein